MKFGKVVMRCACLSTLVLLTTAFLPACGKVKEESAIESRELNEDSNNKQDDIDNRVESDEPVSEEGYKQETESSEDQDTSEADTAERKYDVNDELAEGRIVVKGVFKYMSHYEVLDFLKIEDPNAGYGADETYTVLVIPEQELEVQSGSGEGLRTNSASMISLSEFEHIAEYDGKIVTISIDPNNTWWPSDTRMPLGQPGTNDVRILEVE